MSMQKTVNVKEWALSQLSISFLFLAAPLAPMEEADVAEEVVAAVVAEELASGGGGRSVDVARSEFPLEKLRDRSVATTRLSSGEFGSDPSPGTV